MEAAAQAASDRRNAEEEGLDEFELQKRKVSEQVKAALEKAEEEADDDKEKVGTHAPK